MWKPGKNICKLRSYTKVVFAAPKDGGIDFFYSTYWYVPKSQKLFCVITEDKKNKTHELSKISVN